jgi:hypothetical protein
MISNTVQIYHTSPISQEKVKDLLTKFDKLILELFHDMYRYRPVIYMTVKNIAKRVGCSERHVSRVTTKLNNLGLIRKYRKFIGKIEKCWYKVMPQYLGMFKKEIKKFLDAGPKFAIRILASAATKIQNVSVVNYLRKKNIYIKNNNNLKETYNKKDSTILTNGNNPCYNSSISDEDCLIEQIDYYLNLKNSIKEKEGSAMHKQYENILITKAIHKATEILDLTPAGQATLRAFPDEVILLQLVKVIQSNTSNPVQFVIDECTKHCKEKRIPINWKRSYSLKESYGIAKEDYKYCKHPEDFAKREKPYSLSAQKQNSTKEYVDSGESATKQCERLQQKLHDDEIKRKIAFATPIKEIKIWEDWFHSDNYANCKQRLQYKDSELVAPSVIDIIVGKKISQEEIDRLFYDYPFLIERCKSASTSRQVEHLTEAIAIKVNEEPEPSFKEWMTDF